MEEIRVEVKAILKKQTGEDMWRKWEIKNYQRREMPRNWREKGGEEDRKCDVKTALREM